MDFRRRDQQSQFASLRKQFVRPALVPRCVLRRMRANITSLLSNAFTRARTPPLMPGALLTQPCAGHRSAVRRTSDVRSRASLSRPLARASDASRCRTFSFQSNPCWFAHVPWRARVDGGTELAADAARRIALRAPGKSQRRCRGVLWQSARTMADRKVQESRLALDFRFACGRSVVAKPPRQS